MAGEPGGSVPAIRARIERAWGAAVVDHAGATEVGPWGFADAAGRGLHVNESEFIAEFVSVETGEPAREGELSHLILTSLGRVGAPVIRYRTGDLVRPTWPSESEPNRFVLLDGGVLGRADDMMIIRGVNIFPSAVEQILHGFPEVVEYRLTACKRGALDELVIEVEDHLGAAGADCRGACRFGWASRSKCGRCRRCRCRGLRARAGDLWMSDAESQVDGYRIWIDRIESTFDPVIRRSCYPVKN